MLKNTTSLLRPKVLLEAAEGMVIFTPRMVGAAGATADAVTAAEKATPIVRQTLNQRREARWAMVISKWGKRSQSNQFVVTLSNHERSFLLLKWTVTLHSRFKNKPCDGVSRQRSRQVTPL
jgi:hypothetical protein